MRRTRSGGRLLAAFAVLVALAAGGSSRAQTLSGPSSSGSGNGPVETMQGNLLADPDSLERVMSLQDDAQIQAILNDPATMRAVQSGDLGALMANPKIQALGRNPTVRGLVEQQTR